MKCDEFIVSNHTQCEQISADHCVSIYEMNDEMRRVLVQITHEQDGYYQ